jgi:6-phosphogluconolactonase (cycloisomerase 2 family)
MFAPFYGLTGTGFIWGWSIDSAGRLTSLGTIKSDSFYQNRYATVDPSGQYLLSAFSNGGTLHSFRIDHGTGALTPKSAITGAPCAPVIPANQSTLAVTGVIH